MREKIFKPLPRFAVFLARRSRPISAQKYNAARSRIFSLVKKVFFVEITYLACSGSRVNRGPEISEIITIAIKIFRKEIAYFP